MATRRSAIIALQSNFIQRAIGSVHALRCALTTRQSETIRSGIWRNERGAVSLLSAVSIVSLIGFIGLATEAGSWYLSNRQGQNAADASAVAGAMTLATSSNHASTLAAAYGTATRNGFTTGGSIVVVASNPPSHPDWNANNNAVEVIVHQAQNLGFSRLFNENAATVTNLAVALIQSTGDACVLALKRTLILSGSMQANAPNCLLASNKPGDDSIQVGNAVSLNVGSLTAVGECDGCDNPDTDTLQLVVPYTEYGTPTDNPFEALDTQTWPSYSSSNCDNTNYGAGDNNATLTPTYSNAGLPNNGGLAYCGQLHMNSGDTFVLEPGIYVFYEADIHITGGSLTCSAACSDTNGVHIVQIDESGGTNRFQVASTSTVVLKAGSVVPEMTGASPLSPPLAGVLFHRTYSSQDAVGDEIVINGNSDTRLTGGMYAPNADFRFNGTSDSGCTLIVGAGVQLNGDTSLNQADCLNIGLDPPETKTVMLVQ